MIKTLTPDSPLYFSRNTIIFLENQNMPVDPIWLDYVYRKLAPTEQSKPYDFIELTDEYEINDELLKYLRYCYPILRTYDDEFITSFVTEIFDSKPAKIVNDELFKIFKIKEKVPGYLFIMADNDEFVNTVKWIPFFTKGNTENPLQQLVVANKVIDSTKTWFGLKNGNDGKEKNDPLVRYKIVFNAFLKAGASNNIVSEAKKIVLEQMDFKSRMHFEMKDKNIFIVFDDFYFENIKRPITFKLQSILAIVYFKFVLKHPNYYKYSEIPRFKKEKDNVKSYISLIRKKFAQIIEKAGYEKQLSWHYSIEKLTPEENKKYLKEMNIQITKKKDKPASRPEIPMKIHLDKKFMKKPSKEVVKKFMEHAKSNTF